jgi:hypothetical protein
MGSTSWASPETWRAKRNSIHTKFDSWFYLDHERHIPRTFDEAVDLLRPSDQIESVKLEKFQNVVDERSRSDGILVMC